MDMNVQGAWEEGITGKGSVVTILDDGLEKDHPDLIKNYVSLFKKQFLVNPILLIRNKYANVKCMFDRILQLVMI